MSQTHTVPVPEKLRGMIVDARVRYEAQAGVIEKQWAEITGEVTGLEATERELTGRIEALRPKVVASDKASLDMAAAELRLTAVRSALVEARKKTVTAPLDTALVLHALYGVIDHWQATIAALVKESLRPYGVLSDPASSLRDSVEALRQFGTLRGRAEHLRVHRGSIVDIFAVFDRALRGQTLLLKDLSADDETSA